MLVETESSCTVWHSDHRARSITSLVDDINAARVALFANLAGKGAQQGLPLDWPSRFFKRTARAPKPIQAPAPASP